MVVGGGGTLQLLEIVKHAGTNVFITRTKVNTLLCGLYFMLPAGSILLVAAIVFSGATFGTFEKIAQFFKLLFIGKTAFFKIQSTNPINQP